MSATCATWLFISKVVVLEAQSSLYSRLRHVGRSDSEYESIHREAFVDLGLVSISTSRVIALTKITLSSKPCENV